MSAYDEELAAIAAMVREHLAWEEGMGGAAVPWADATESAVPVSPPQGAATADVAGAPAEVTRHPAEVTRHPAEVTRHPAEVARQPEAVARQPEAVARQPEAVARQPDAVARQPDAVARQPDAVARQPEAVAPQPAAATRHPATPAFEPAAAPVTALAPEQKHRALEVLAAEAATCRACRLCEGRTNSVFSRGTPITEIAFVGEGPGYHEDQQGSPFVGPAGQLLDRMVAAMGFDRDAVYVCNVVKCRPPENRTPLPDEAGACEPFLAKQLEIVAPKVIVALGRCAAENLGCAEPGRSWRGMWGTWRGVPVMPTYHPAFLLRSPEMKRPVWEDLQKVLQRLGRQVPPQGSRKG
ncbi:uracil-DNA glycosylase [Sandaracinus amylolyticus]|uniref:Type-4 uracil-DNA glycosylase n=1 Tax=Sandaracinus amylolyticus TaxID=927083 RepID=A0A0F6SFH7_9BACT|nr:uracil-DNA glycosylase [Sandaracinus amylolyticus]AKF06964.1 Uracil-DNA glycosylase, family 4 [Sandaracinus amylolyticus]